MDLMGSAERAVNLTKYFMSLPRARVLWLYLALAGMLFGIAIISIRKGEVGFSSAIEGMATGIFLITVPALLSAITFYILKREIVLRRVIFLSLVAAAIYGSFYIAGALLERAGMPLGNEVVFVGFGLAFVMWFFIVGTVFGLGKAAFLFSLLQLCYNAAFLLASRQIGIEQDWLLAILKMYFASFLFLVGLYMLFFLINAPMKRNIGVKSTDAISMFAAQWLNREKDLEETFEEMGEEVETLLGVLCFEGKRQKITFLVPYVHFGPFGNLGGSEFPKILAQRIGRGSGGEVFVFHGTCTHDFNPVAGAEAEKIIQAYEFERKKMKFSPAKGAILEGKNGNSGALCLLVNDCAFASFTRAPKTTEDVNFAIGRSLMNIAGRYAKTAIVVDEHNSETGDITSVEPGSPIAFEMEDALLDALSKKAGMKKMRLGIGKKNLSSEPAIGGNGIKAALFDVGKLFAYVVIDSNGVTPEFRSELMETVQKWGRGKGLKIGCEVFTTDTHEVNNVQGVLNPIGKRGGAKTLDAVLECLSGAYANLEEVKAGSALGRMRIEVFGSRQSIEMVATISSVVAIARIAAPTILIGTVVAILWGLTKIK